MFNFGILMNGNDVYFVDGVLVLVDVVGVFVDRIGGDIDYIWYDLVGNFWYFVFGVIYKLIGNFGVVVGSLMLSDYFVILFRIMV